MKTDTKTCITISTMNSLINKISNFFKKTGLPLLVILFLIGCKKEKHQVGLTNPDRIAIHTHFTDTISIKSEVVLINDSLVTSNVTSGLDNTSYLMAGAYTDPLTGSIAAHAYTQLRLSQEYIELPAATPDSAILFLSYDYFYGDKSQAQTLNVYKLTEAISTDQVYYSNSPGRNYDPAAIGTVTFQASADSGANVAIKITDMAYLQAILNGPKNNSFFRTQFPGLAILPANNTDGAVIRINGGAAGTVMKIFYQQYGQNKVYSLNLNINAQKYYRIENDRSGTALAPLTSSYDAIETSLIANRCYLQACTGVRTRLSFPYLKKLKEDYPNIVLVRGELLLQSDPASAPATYAPNTKMTLMRTEENGRIKKASDGTIYYVQGDDRVQASTGYSVIVDKKVDDNTYSFPMKSYVQAILLDQIPNNPLIVSPVFLSSEMNRTIFNDYSGTSAPVKLKLYFTTAKN
jgi:hypothetical protein